MDPNACWHNGSPMRCNEKRTMKSKISKLGKRNNMGLTQKKLRTQSDSERPQVAAFKALAQASACDQSEVTFDKALGKIGHAAPARKRKKRATPSPKT
jgi:hypothetical protein